MMRIVIVGCGRIGSALAGQLQKKGHHVTVIDQNAAAFDHLPLDFRGRMVEGDALTRNVLLRAELETADALVAVTRSDTLNALIAHIAKVEYNVPRAIARNYDARLRPIQETFDVQIIGSAAWRVQRIEEMLSNGPLHTAFTDHKANFALFQVTVPREWHGRTLQEIFGEDLPQVLSWTRGSQPLEIHGERPAAAGDLLYLRGTPQELAALRKRLHLTQEPAP